MSETDRLIGGRYRIVKKIAEGGMGAVYEAQHNLSKKAVALKILFEHIGRDEAARSRFLREVSAPAQIGHDGIVEVYDAGFDTEDGSLFVAMELLKGEPLRDRLMKGGHSLEKILGWFDEILDPLSAAHASGIVHRDLKPENIFVTTRRDGSEMLKILDFGIARDLDGSDTNVTHTGIAMGTPHYMAPEQAMSAKGVTAAADVWAMGAMLYEALAGQPPFTGETASAIVVNACTRQHSSLTQVAPHVPQQLAFFVDRCLSKEATARPQNAGQMLSELRHIRGGGAATPAPPVGGFTPRGTAVLPAQTPPPGMGYGTAPVGGYGTPPPMSAPGYQTGVPGYQTGVPGYQTGVPPYQTGAPGPFGQHPSAPGSFVGAQPGSFVGSPPPGSFVGSAPGQYGPPSAYGTMAGGAPQKSGGGMAMGVIAAVVIALLLVVGGGIVVVVIALNSEDSTGDDDDGDDDAPTGTVVVTSNVTGGELFIDGTSHGPLVTSERLSLAPGVHHLEVRSNGQPVASRDVTVLTNEEQTAPMDYQMQPGIQTPGFTQSQTFSGQLRPGDTQLPNGKYYDSYTFDWTAGQRVRLELDSVFDNYLIIVSPSGAEEYNDDRVGGNFNAALEVTLAETGRYTVQCTTFSTSVTGDYVLTLRTP